jgi:hypothetical protein
MHNSFQGLAAPTTSGEMKSGFDVMSEPTPANTFLRDLLAQIDARIKSSGDFLESTKQFAADSPTTAALQGQHDAWTDAKRLVQILAAVHA